ncbi:MAG: VacJ family lipoprotein [Pseudomonadota bacterium]
MNKTPKIWPTVGLVFCLALSGCATLEGEDYDTYDPWEGFNRTSYEVSDAVDRTVLVPVARVYKKVTPDWLESGIGNVFLNVRTISSSANGFLQGKPESGFTDLGRILINTTVGIGGFFDVATPWGLRFQNEDLGQTLAVWGVTKSRYIYVPFMGPTTLRDLPSNFINSYIPRALFGSDYHWSLSALDVVNTRAQLLSASAVRDASALDPYAFTRDAYFQRRKFLIYDGDPPIEDFFDDFGDDDFEDDEDF